MAEEKEGFFTASDDNEDISLSESELANILGDTVATDDLSPAPAPMDGADISAPSIDDIESSTAVPLADDGPAMPAITEANEERGLDAVEESSDDEKLTIDDAAIDLDNLPDASDIALDIGTDDALPSLTEPAAEGAKEGGFFAETEDETISLSDGELENILADVEDVSDVPTASTAVELPEVPSMEAPAPVERKGRAAASDDIFSMDAGDEIIALSGDELNEILSDEEARREREDAVRERPAQRDPEVVDLSSEIDESAIQNDIDELSRKMDSAPDLPPMIDDTPAPAPAPARKAPKDNFAADLSAPLDDSDIAKLQKEAQSSSNVLESMNFENEIMKESGVDAPAFEQPIADTLPIPPEELPTLSAEPEDAPVAAKRGKPDFDGTISEADLTGALKRFADESGLTPQTKQKGSSAVSVPTGEGLKELLSYFDELLANLPEEKIKRFAESRYYDLYTSLLKKHGI
ncbi:MAG: hypothetical protein AABZ39_07530 [Spirochaetota bacterium]